MTKDRRSGGTASLPPRFCRTALALAAGAFPIVAPAVPGDRVGGEFRINATTAGTQSEVAIAAAGNGSFVAVWSSASVTIPGDIYARRFDPAGNPLGSEFLVNSTTSGYQSQPAVAVDGDGDFVVVWVGESAAGGEIFGQRFDASGARLGGEIPINGVTANQQSEPVVAREADGDFVVAWSTYPPKTINARRFNVNGVPLAADFQVNSATRVGLAPALAMDADGDFALAWDSSSGDFATDSATYARLYDSAGVPRGVEFRVGTSTANQAGQAIAMDADGDMVVAWHANYADEQIYGVHAQRFDRLGVVQGARFRLGGDTVNAEVYPALAMDTQGSFVASWISIDPGGSNTYRIQARRYTRLGAPVGAEFQVNTFTTGQKLYPSVAVDPRGAFVIAWNSNDQDGDDTGVYAQRYAGRGALTAALPDLNGNFTPEIAGFTWNGTAWSGRVRDGYTGELLYTVPVTANYELADVAFHGDAATPKLALALLKDDATGSRLEVRPLAGGVTGVSFGAESQPIRLRSIPDVDGDAAPDIAYLDRIDSGSVRVLVRNGDSLVSIRNLFYDPAYRPLDVVALPDLSGNAKAELAVLGQHDTTGAVRVETRDAFTGALFNTTLFNPDIFPYALATTTDINGGGKPELVVIGVDDVHQATVAQLLDSVTDRIVRLVYFNTYAPVRGLAVLPDQSGNGKPELAVLQQDPALGRPQVEIRDAATNALVRVVPFSVTLEAPSALLSFDDYDGTTRPELGVLATRKDNGIPRVQIRDSESGLLIRTSPVP